MSKSTTKPAAGLAAPETATAKAIQLPSRETVLALADQLFDAYVGPRIPRPLLRAAANELLIYAVGLAYDRIAAR